MSCIIILCTQNNYIILIIVIIQAPPGQTFQWTFVIPLLQTSAISAQNGDVSSTDGPFTGPEYCVTLPAVSSVDDKWPSRTTSTVPTVFAELTLIGTSMADAVRSEILTNIVSAIQSYLCPKEQKVWYVIMYIYIMYYIH